MKKKKGATKEDQATILEVQKLRRADSKAAAGRYRCQN